MRNSIGKNTTPPPLQVRCLSLELQFALEDWKLILRFPAKFSEVLKSHFQKAFKILTVTENHWNTHASQAFLNMLLLVHVFLFHI